MFNYGVGNDLIVKENCVLEEKIYLVWCGGHIVDWGDNCDGSAKYEAKRQYFYSCRA